MTTDMNPDEANEILTSEMSYTTTKDISTVLGQALFSVNEANKRFDSDQAALLLQASAVLETCQKSQRKMDKEVRATQPSQNPLEVQLVVNKKKEIVTKGAAASEAITMVDVCFELTEAALMLGKKAHKLSLGAKTAYTATAGEITGMRVFIEGANLRQDVEAAAAQSIKAVQDAAAESIKTVEDAAAQSETVLRSEIGVLKTTLAEAETEVKDKDDAVDELTASIDGLMANINAMRKTVAKHKAPLGANTTANVA